MVDDLREEIRILWGDQGIAALAFGQSCQRLTIGDDTLVPAGRPHLRQVA